MEEPVIAKEAFEESVWRNAMEVQLKAHRVNGTWRLVKLAEERKVIESRWIYKVKKIDEIRDQRFESTLRGKYFNYNLINICAPTIDKPDNMKDYDMFYKCLACNVGSAKEIGGENFEVVE